LRQKAINKNILPILDEYIAAHKVRHDLIGVDERSFRPE
jgi:hypothetical protein